ncbi:hypothetical protein ACQEVZ_24730 [Dactylosporangium sp. CA-152071]|uniref:hypothetical protein n=1 Tax=Dactylosporangium sp. CA-152071 TaxID=3239933 RepID=UPI003D8A6404
MTIAPHRPHVGHLPGACSGGPPWCTEHIQHHDHTDWHTSPATVVPADRSRGDDAASVFVAQLEQPEVHLMALVNDGTELETYRFSPNRAFELAAALFEAACTAVNAVPAGRLQIGDYITVGGTVQSVVALLHDLWCCTDTDCPGEVQVFTDLSEETDPDTPALHVRVDAMVQLGASA